MGCEGGVVGSGDEGRVDVVGWLVGVLEERYLTGSGGAYVV